MYHRGLRALRSFLGNERGSISILTIGLFAILLATSLILTDISSIYLAKRSLTATAEAAAQRGVSNLDLKAYYTGEYNLSRAATNLFAPEQDPGIPINCDEGRVDAIEVITGWEEIADGLSRPELGDISLTDFQCDGYQVALSLSAEAKLPIPIPFLGVDGIELHSSASSIGERRR